MKIFIFDKKNSLVLEAEKIGEYWYLFTYKKSFFNEVENVLSDNDFKFWLNKAKSYYIINMTY